MFVDPHVAWREYQLAKERIERAREQVFWCADQVYLAVYHRRPEAEISSLLADLYRVTRRAD
jgi:hypothetical protein